MYHVISWQGTYCNCPIPTMLIFFEVGEYYYNNSSGISEHLTYTITKIKQKSLNLNTIQTAEDNNIYAPGPSGIN